MKVQRKRDNECQTDKPVAIINTQIESKRINSTSYIFFNHTQQQYTDER